MYLSFEPSSAFLWVWGLFLLFATLVLVPVVAMLLLRLVMACVRLNRHAEVADVAAIPVRTNTDAVPMLNDSMAIIRDVLRVARTVEQHGAQLETVLKRDMVTR